LSQIFSSFKIILGLPLSDELEDQLSNAHNSLIGKQFYASFRAESAKILGTLRQELESNTCKEIDDSVGLSDFQIRLGFQQKLILKTLYSLNLKKAIAYSTLTGNNIIFPISKNVRHDFTESIGLQFNRFGCAVTYFFLVFLFFLNSSRKLLFSLFRFRNLQNSTEIINGAKMVYLHNFPIETFPNLNYPSHNFAEWLISKSSENLVIFHNNEHFKLENHPNIRMSFRFAPTLICEVPLFYRLSAFFKLSFFLCVNLKNVIILISILTQMDEVYTSILLSKKRKFFRAEQIIFPNSVSVQRPLWSFVLERRSCQIVFAHYSASAEPSKAFGFDLCDGIWHLSTWSKSWVVDDIQIEYAKKMSANYSQEFEVVGVPYWSGQIMNELPKGNIFIVSVFDTYIRANQAFSANIIDDLGWNNFDLERLFISEILGTTKSADMTIIHKRKRPIKDRNSSKRQVNNLSLLSRYGKSYFVIDESFSAESVVDLSHLVIVKPISTVAFIAKERAKPVIFFDPTGNLEKGDPMLRGIPLASNTKELHDLIFSIYNEVKI